MVTDPERLVSFVIGNGWTKTWSLNEQALFESVIAAEQGGVRFDGFKSSQDFIISYCGNQYAIGQKTVGKMGDIPVTQMDRSRIGKEFFKTLMAAALVATLPESGPVAAVFTMPLAWYEDRDGLKAMLQGEYTVGYNGKTYMYTLDKSDIRVVVEGFGVLAREYLDEDGDTTNQGIAQQSIGVIEVGTGTTDLSFFKSLEIQPKRSDGLKMGLSKVWRGVSQDIMKSPTKRQFTLHETDEIIRTGFYMNNGKQVDVSEFTKRHMPGLASAIKGQVNDLWDGGSAADRILLAGGGGWQINQYTAEYPHKTLVKKGHSADAEGAFRYGLFRIKNRKSSKR